MRDENPEESDRDAVYRRPLGAIPPFSFGEDVAAVFDDMASRSIPFYREVQRLVIDLAVSYTIPGSRVYDLGCSTGTTLLGLREAFAARGAAEVELIGVDSSLPMCERAKEKLSTSDSTEPLWRIVSEDILDQRIEGASVVIMNYTLQFVPPLRRRELLDRIYRGLRPGGALLISDKLLQSSTEVSKVFADIYYDFKRAQGYSELEISQKREALENVLVPCRFDEERELLLASGFSTVDVFFGWCNFASFICVKR